MLVALCYLPVSIKAQSDFDCSTAKTLRTFLDQQHIELESLDEGWSQVVATNFILRLDSHGLLFTQSDFSGPLSQLADIENVIEKDACSFLETFNNLFRTRLAEVDSVVDGFVLQDTLAKYTQANKKPKSLSGYAKSINDLRDRWGGYLKMAYMNQVYLIYFKSRIEERYLWEAAKEGDLSAMEQRKNAMVEFAQEGIVKLQELGGFNGGKGLIIAASKALRIFESQGLNDIQKLQDFYLNKEEWETIKTAFDKIRSSDRTQEDVDRYNGALKKYNAGIDTFHNTIGSANKGSTTAVNGYNEAKDKFRNRHIPRYR